MTLTVGSTGSSGGTQPSSGTQASDGAAPSGFDALLAGARPTPDRPDDAQIAKAHHDKSREARDAENADAVDTPKNETPGDPATKTDANDPFGLAGAQGAPVVTTTPTPAPTPVAITTEATAATTEVPVVTAPEIDPNAFIAAATAEPDPTPLTDVVAALLAESAGAPGDATGAPPATPKLVPLPDLPAPPPRPNTDNASAAADPKLPPPTPAAISAATADHPREAAPALAPTGSAAVAVTAPMPTITGAAANVSAEVATTTAATVTPPPASEQVVSVLKPMRNTETGTYTLRLELKPPELGRVEMRVEMRDGVLHASIHAEHQGSAQMLRDALGELRDRLGAEGVRTGDLTVSDGGVGSRQQERADASDARTPQPSAARGDDVNLVGTPNAAPTLETETTSLLDVRV